jgi:histidine ammonia-lyase
MLAYAASVVERELNAATDNPLVLTDTNGDNTNGDAILSGGNFHGEPLALAFDAAAMATSELASISERRLELMLNPNYSGLPPFLTENSGINSGYMAMQYLAASLVNANKILANPASTDSIPGNVGIEDHVSMGATSARKFTELVGHVRTILAIELLAAAQAVDLRKVKKMGIGTKKTHGQLRKKVKHLSNDRIIADDVEKAVEVVKNMTNIAEGPSKHY